MIYYLNPDFGYVLPARAKFLPYAHIDLRQWKVVQRIHERKPLVVHAPSNRGVKGTEVIVQIVERLKDDGMDFNFSLVEGMPNNEARKVYEQADLLVDQLYAGWYGGASGRINGSWETRCNIYKRIRLKFIPEKMRQELPVD